MNNKWIIFAFTLFFIQMSTAQKYNTVGGIRLGTDWGITAKQRIQEKTTIEAIIQSSLRREETIATVIWEKHNPLLGKRFNFFTGAGMHKGWNTDKTQEGNSLYGDPFGFTFIAGVEMTLGDINLSWDYKPAINITGGEHFFYSQTGISLRYIFVKPKRKKMKINWKFWQKKDN